MKKRKDDEEVICSNIGWVDKTVPAGTYRSIYIPPGGTDAQKADAIEDMLKKLGYEIDSLCTGSCTDATKKCRCTILVSITTDDCNLTLEEEEDGTRYYKAVFTGAGKTSLRCRSIADGDGCKCL